MTGITKQMFTYLFSVKLHGKQWSKWRSACQPRWPTDRNCCL